MEAHLEAGNLLEREKLPSGAVIYRSPALEALGVPHLFTTRRGPGGEPLDPAPLEGPVETLLLGLLGRPEAKLVGLRQVHGDLVRRAEDTVPLPPLEGDALVSERRDRALAVRAADCVPVLLASPDGGTVAAVHAGWRGLVAGVLPRAAESMAGAGGVAVAAIGPCLSLERFEVGPEVAAAFDAADLADTVLRRPGRRPHVDLRRAARLQLARAGASHVDVSDRCTWNDREDFYSYRRDGGLRGRLAALIAPR